MPSVVRAASPQQSHTLASKKNFRTVLGFGPYSRDSSDTDVQQPEDSRSIGYNLSFARKSIDTPRSYISKRKNKADRLSVSNTSFFDRNVQNVQTSKDPSTPSTTPSVVDLTMSEKNLVDAAIVPAATRRPVVRLDNYDGPWSVSVAETPHDARSYSLYIKTPTHNITLTRTAMEIIELDEKLRDALPDITIPNLPITVDHVPTPKRKSNFLHTLSRLASPTSGKTHRQTSGRRSNNSSSMPSTVATPLTSPSGEIGDPFSSFTTNNVNSSTIIPAPTASSTAIAAYLTTVSNIGLVRQARVWKRFVRVRTDDLESVRVERAIKRVRSDLAAHTGMSRDTESIHRTSIADYTAATSDDRKSDKASIIDKKAAEQDHEQAQEANINHSSETEITQNTEPESTQLDNITPKSDDVITDGTSKHTNGSIDIPNGDDPTIVNTATPPAEETVTTPIASETPPSRIHRSHSADPDKSSRISRAYVSSVPSQDNISSATGDESSVSTPNGSRRASGRKKRSVSSVPKEPKKSRRKVVIDDFEMMRVLGKGCAGKVLLVKHKTTTDLFALKAITKRHVLAHQELQHTLTEQAVLKRMAAESRDPFVVKLWWSFHDKENLFLVMDFHPGGDLATQLARWGRLGRDRARFYAAEIVEGVEGLHAAGVIYRDLKPENILIGADGHIVLTDFGLSKEFPRRSASSSPVAPSTSRGSEFYSSAPGSPQPVTPPWMKPDRTGELALGWPGQPVGHSDSTSTFCGTAEYLAPEVIQGLPYSYEVDWWSFGTMLYEMLTGITPFWANNHSDMYVRVLQDELQFPDDRAIDQDTKSLIRGLLQRNPGLRICEPRIKRHPYFSMIDWSHVYYKRYIPPYIPPIDPSNASDTQNFDDTFLDMEPVLDDFNDDPTADTDQEPQTDADRTDGEETNTTPSQSRSSSIKPIPRQPEDDTVDVFDGYSFKGRHSVILDDDDDEDEDTNYSEEESVEEEEGTDPSLHNDVESKTDVVEDEEVVEPKTPEARPAVLPELVPEATPSQPEAPLPPVLEQIKEDVVETADVDHKTLITAETVVPPPSEPLTPIVTNAETTAVTPPLKVAPRPAPHRTRGRREKSGVPALDKYLSDAVDDTEATEAERDDDEDDDWDFIEAADGEDRNGTKGPSLFARGVVDRYRLAVFRKASTPSQRSAPRSFSGMSKASDATVSETTESPSPSQRRGRTPGLNFRKHPRQFLRPKSPPSSKSSVTAKSLTQSNSNTFSAASSNGLLTPSPSVGSSIPMSPSLKSKESAVSVGNHSLSSDPSVNGGSPSGVDDTGHIEVIKAISAVEEPEKQKTRKLKKYKEGAEKVFSLFSSPRQA